MALIYSYPLADEVTNESWVLGSEMDNGSRVVKNYSVGDLASFTRGFVTLNDVLDNDNVSQIDAKVGGIFLYNTNVASGLGYPYIKGDKNRFNFYNNVDEYYGSLSQDTLSLVNVGDEYQLDIMKPAAVTNNRTVTFQDADGTVALTDDLLDYVPYTGATQSIDLGNYDIFTAGNARLGDDGTVWGSSFQFGNNGSLQSAAQSSIAWVLPDEGGTIALTKYKIYTALLTQSGTNAPVATVLENTLGATITWSYVGVGQYYATASSTVFTAGKTTGILSNSSSTGINAFVNISTTVFNTVTTSSGVAANNELVKNMVEIRVYN
jgi:hypothetical protein